MYMHYQHIQLNSGTKLTKLKFSSYSHLNKIQGTNDFQKLKELVGFIKQIPATSREYDSKLNIWIIPRAQFNNLEGIFKTIYSIDTKEHTDLKRWAEGLLEVEPEQVNAAPKPEDFFYSTQQPVGQPKIDKETARKLFVDFISRESISVFENGDLIKSYKLAARKLHPDLNGGDARKMTELNSLWQQYKSLAGV